MSNVARTFKHTGSLFPQWDGAAPPTGEVVGGATLEIVPEAPYLDVTASS